MKIMRKLYDQTMEELDGVIEYSCCAMKHREMHPDISKMYATMAKEEMGHALTLHGMSQRLAASKMGTSEEREIDPRLMELWEEMEDVKLDKMASAEAHLALLNK